MCIVEDGGEPIQFGITNVKSYLRKDKTTYRTKNIPTTKTLRMMSPLRKKDTMSMFLKMRQVCPKTTGTITGKQEQTRRHGQ